MIDYLVRGNHRWENIIDGYPITVVKNLYKAGREHERTEHLQFVTGVSIAVTNAIDMCFNKGKGKVLSTYIKMAVKEGEEEKKLEEKEEPKPKGTKVSGNVMALFNSLPKVE